MRITFLSPEAAAVGLIVIVPIAALTLAESRARIARAVLRLPPPVTRGWPYLAAIGVFAVCVAVGAAQPVLERERIRPLRSDAEAFFIFDTTRSMKASSSPGSATRFERARSLGKQMRLGMGDVRVGVGSLTDRVLPHLFPSGNPASFVLTLDKTLGIERPASVQRGNGLGSSLQAFAGIPKQSYFGDEVANRVLVVFTDAESRPFDTAVLRDSFRGSNIRTVVVRFGSTSERVYEGRATDRQYVPRDGRANAERFAEATGGEVFEEGDSGDAVSAVREAAGAGRASGEVRAFDPTPLASYAFAAAFLPLAFLLWRRNFM
jgi:hypothetical protein